MINLFNFFFRFENFFINFILCVAVRCCALLCNGCCAESKSMPVSICEHCEHCDRKVIKHELGGCQVSTCPSCGLQDPSVTTSNEDHFRMVMQCIALGLVFLSMGSMDDKASPKLDEEELKARTEYLSILREGITAREAKFAATPNIKRKRGSRNKDAQVYEEIARENDKITRKLVKDPDYRSKSQEIWKVLGAFTAEVDGQTVTLVFALGANSHLGEIHPQARTSFSVQNYWLPLILGVDQLST